MNQITGISFDAFFDNVSMGIVITDQFGIIVLTNTYLQQQFGYTAAELNGKTIDFLIPARFHNAHLKHIRNYNTHPKNRPMGIGIDLYATHKDATEFPVEVSLGIFETEQGRYITAFVSDITRRKEAEKALKQLNDALETKINERTRSLTESVRQLAQVITETEKKDAELVLVNAFLKSIWKHARAIIFTTDVQGKILIVNEATEQELGYTQEELAGIADPTLFYDTTTKCLGNTLTADFLTIKFMADEGNYNDLEVNFKHKNGNVFPVVLSITPIINQSGILEGYLGIGTNNSAQKRAEADLRAALNKEKELSELKSRFVSLASHEFRTPLSTVLSSAYLISKYINTKDNSKREKHVNRIVSSVNQLTDILNDFLSVGKMEEGKIQVHHTNFNIADSIKTITSDFMGLLKSGQKISYEHHGSENVFFDQGMLRHILSNLCSNAIKFSPEKTIITILSIKNEQGLLISMKDVGMGISEEDFQHLFERFFRGSNVAHIQGTGLGLHIVSKYVELLNGEITCTSKLGEGTEFIINFKL